MFITKASNQLLSLLPVFHTVSLCRSAGRQIQEYLNFTNVVNIEIVIFLIGPLVVSHAGAIHPFLNPSSVFPPLGPGKGVSGGHRQRLLQWQQSRPPGMLHCSNMVTLGRNKTHHLFNTSAVLTK